MSHHDAQNTNFLEVAIAGDTAYLRLHGRITFEHAPAILSFISHARDQGVKGFLIDMSACVTLDSTVIGIITSQTLRQKNEGRRIILFNLSEHVREILTTLGLEKVLEIADRKSCPTLPFERAEDQKTSKIEISRIMLDAHETLSEINQENAVEFKNVVTYLRQKLS